jgi:hypothetical protein
MKMVLCCMRARYLETLKFNLAEIASSGL